MTLPKQRTIAAILLIIAIVIIIIFIIHVLRVKKTPGNGGRVFVHGTYSISVKPKTKKNPYYGKGSDNCFYLNDIEAPKIVLQRGVYYEFQNTSSEPLYFSTDSKGGKGAPGSLAKNKEKGFHGLAEGTIFFFITDDLPTSFYYQSGKHEYMGGKVEIS